MRILHVANGLPPSARAGVEQYTLALAREQMQRHSVSIFCRERAPHVADYTIYDEIQSGLPIRRVVNNFRRVSGLESHYRDPTIEDIFRAYVRDTRPDLIHFQHCIGLSAGLPAIAGQLRIPIVLTLHDYWYICPTTRLLTRQMAVCSGPHRNAECGGCLGLAVAASGVLHRIPAYERLRDTFLPRFVQREALRLLERSRAASRFSAGRMPQAYLDRMRFMQRMLAGIPRLIAPSAFCARVYLDYGVRAEALRVLPWGMDLARWGSVPTVQFANRLRFGYIGTLAAHKGVDVLVRAFRRLRGENVELHVFGANAPDDPFESELRRTASGDTRIRFHGRYDNERLPGLLADIDVVVIPSRWHETFSIATHEALLAGRAVIASRVGAIPEVIVDGLNGLLVPPSDEACLTAALVRLQDDRALAAHLAQAAKATSHVSMAQHAEHMESVYDDLLRASRRGDVYIS